MEENVNSLAYHERRSVALLNDIGMERTRHEREMKRLNNELQTSKAAINAFLSGVDLAKVALARTVIEVRGLYEKAGDERGWAVDAAVQRIADGGEKLRHNYVGTKNYAHWFGQSVEHAYLCGPKHGSVVFSIGLTNEVRKRPELAGNSLLSSEEMDAAIYYLRCLKQIQQAEQDAKVAA